MYAAPGADPEVHAGGGGGGRREGLGAVHPAGVRGQSPRWGSGGRSPPEAAVLMHSV